MTLIDLFCAIFLLASLAHGWRRGFITIVGNLLSLAVGFIVTTQVVAWISASPNIFGTWVKNWHLDNPISSIVIFSIIYFVVVKILRFLVHLLDSLWSIVAWIPLIGKLNNILGALLGFLSGVLTLLVLIYITKNFIIGTLWHIAPTDYWGQAVLTSTTYIRGTTLLSTIKTLTPNLMIWR